MNAPQQISSRIIYTYTVKNKSILLIRLLIQATEELHPDILNFDMNVYV